MTQITQNQLITKARALQEIARREALRRGLIPDLEAAGNPIEDSQVMTLWDWAEKHFYIPESNGRLILYPHQLIALKLAMSTDEVGLFQYSTVVWSDIKKSAKTTIAAARALYTACRQNWASVKIVANDQKQADSRVMAYIKRAIQLHPYLRENVKVTNRLINLPNNSVIESVALDPQGEAGGNDDLIIFSELWAASSDRAKLMWTEMTLSPTKYGRSQRWVESYAGFTGKSEQLEQLFNQGTKQGARVQADLTEDNELIVEEVKRERPQAPEVFDCFFLNQPARLFVLWNKVPRLPWQTEEYYTQEAASLWPSEFARVHQNDWATPASKFVEDEQWAACYDPNPPQFTRELLIPAMDAGVSSDNFAIVGVTRVKDHYYVRFVRIFKPPKNGQIDFKLPELEIRKLLTPRGQPVKLNAQDKAYYEKLNLGLAGYGYRVPLVAYDQFQLVDMAQRFKAQTVVHCRKFSQQADRAIADKFLWDIIIQGRLHHTGDLDLTEHVCNAYAKKENERMRLVKPGDITKKIDGAVALSMAAYTASQLNI